MTQPSTIANSTAVACLTLGDATSCDVRNTPSVLLYSGRQVTLHYNDGDNGDRSIWVTDGATTTSHPATVGLTGTASVSIIFPSSVRLFEGGGYSTSAGNKITLPHGRTVTIAHNPAGNVPQHLFVPFIQWRDGSTLSQDGGPSATVGLYPQVQWGPHAGTRASTAGTST